MIRLREYRHVTAYQLGFVEKPLSLVQAAYRARLMYPKYCVWLETNHISHTWVVADHKLIVMISLDSDARLFEMTWA